MVCLRRPANRRLALLLGGGQRTAKQFGASGSRNSSEMLTASSVTNAS